MTLIRKGSSGLIGTIVGAALFCGVVNILALAAPLFMLEIYDRVLPARHLPTLVALLGLVIGLFAFSGLLDILRGRIMTRFAAAIDITLSPRVFAVIAGAPLKIRSQRDVLKPAQELDQIRSFLAGPGPVAIFDLPWLPIYLAICFIIHPLVGWLTAAAIILLVLLTVATDLRTRSLTKKSSIVLGHRNRWGEAANRNAEAIFAMGMHGEATRRWSEVHMDYTSLQRRGTDIGTTMGGFAKSIRQMLQSGVLALGAYLVIQGDMSGGMIVAASVIVARTLAPAEQMLGNWRGLVGTWQAWKALNEVLRLFPDVSAKTVLPAPKNSIVVQGIHVAPPGEKRMVVQNVSFRADAGTVIGVIGASASGKSSLTRALVGVWPLSKGDVRLDGANLDQWTPEQRGRYIGYVPQGIDLMPGTVAQNIARLDPAACDAVIVSAARSAGLHELIVQLPDGYNTQVGDGGMNLSAGQRQRVALARALYGDPFLVVMDEPNSNLDADGERALADAIAGIRKRGGIVVVAAHRTSILSAVDFLLIMEGGTAKAFGPRDAVLATLQSRPAPQRSYSSSNLKVVEDEAAAQ